MHKRKVGIMGGTFDPIHNGHLILAEHSRIQFDLEKVIFIPTGKPPHKVEKGISLINHRYDMTLLAICTNKYFDLSLIEIQREGTTYTIDTIKQLKTENKDTDYYFILGADSLFNISSWKGYEELLNICNFIVAKRPSTDNNKLKAKIEELNKIHKDPIYILETPLIDISSSSIRERVRSKLSIKYLVPDVVELYIKKNRLYDR